MSGFILERAYAVRENVVRLVFSHDIQMSGVLDKFDGTRKLHYAFAEGIDSFGLDGSPARPVRAGWAVRGSAANEADVWLDRPLTPYPSIYEVFTQDLYNTDGDKMVGVQGAVFLGLYRGVVPPTPDLTAPSRDIANPQTLSGLLDPLPVTTDSRILGTYPVDETGDIAFDEGLASYKKRVIRRLTTRLGAFAHLPTYGVTIFQRIKQLARPGLIQQLAQEAREQIMQEPETQACSVRIITQGSIVYYQLRIRTSAGQSFGMNVPAQGVSL